MILHPFMTLAQLGDSPRVPPVQQYDTFVEPDVHQQPVSTAAPDEVDIDVHQQYIFLVFCVCCFLFYFITNNCYVYFFLLTRMVI